jgi:hypothetical protein
MSPVRQYVVIYECQPGIKGTDKFLQLTGLRPEFTTWLDDATVFSSKTAAALATAGIKPHGWKLGRAVEMVTRTTRHLA